MAEFAAGVRDRAEWRMWIAFRAGRLARVMDRALFEQLKADPDEGLAAVMRHEGVTVRTVEPVPAPSPDDVVSPEEYEVYTAVCRQLDMFLFDRPDTVFEDQTDGDSVGRMHIGLHLEFDEPRREYRVVRSDLAWQASPPFRGRLAQHPEMFRQYESRNQRRWPLQKQFEVQNGYRFVPELGEGERDLAQGAFCLSRVGFSADGRCALVFIRYAVTCSYHLVFERSATGWQRAEYSIAWVS